MFSNWLENFRKYQYQILATIVGNIVCLGQGCAIGWTAPSLAILLSDQDSPFEYGSITPNQASWISSFIGIGSFCGTFFFGILINYIGSKKSLTLCAFPIICSWILVEFSEDAWYIYLARISSGLGGGGLFLCIPLFVAEIATDSVRGQLSSLMQLHFNIGILLGFIGSSYIGYRTVPIIMVTLPIIFLCIFIFLPNSPQYLLKLKKIEDAKKAHRFYRNVYNGNDKDERILKEEFEKFVAIANQNELSSKIEWSDIFNRDVMKAIAINPTLMAVSQFSGTFTLINWAVIIFHETGSTIDPFTSTITIGFIQVIGTCCGSSFIDRWGRKMLLLISTGGGAIGLITTGTFTYLKLLGYNLDAFNWVPIVSLSFFMFVSAIGIIPVPYVLAAEMFPQKVINNMFNLLCYTSPKTLNYKELPRYEQHINSYQVRRIGATFCTCSVSVFAFIILSNFTKLLSIFGLHGCMWMFSSVSIFGFIFTLFAVTETKGTNLDVLHEKPTKEII